MPNTSDSTKVAEAFSALIAEVFIAILAIWITAWPVMLLFGGIWHATGWLAPIGYGTSFMVILLARIFLKKM